MTARTRQTALYVVTDWISTSVAVLLFNMVRYAVIPGAKTFYTLGDYLSSTTVMTGQVLFPLGMLLVYYMSGYYLNVFSRSRLVEFTTTLGSALIGTLVIIFVALINDLTTDRTQDYRVFFIVFGLLFFVVYIPRLIITSLTYRRITRNKLSFPAAVIGLGSCPAMFDDFSRRRMPHLGLKPAARIYADNIIPDGQTDMARYRIDDIQQAIDQCGLTQLIVLPHPDGWEATLEVINRLYMYDLPILVPASDLPPYLLNNRLLSFTADPLIDMSHSHLPPSSLCIKRTLDVAVSAVMMVLTAPVVATLAVAVKLTSPGPAFYPQERVGHHRRLFTMYKLRSMTADAEADGKARLSVEGDSRITPLGAFMRKYRLDELPQFFNVLRGDMSLVGPRPERLYFVEQIEAREPSHALLHRVRPGITSLGMVKFGYASTVDEMVERMRYDMIYLQNISILSDLKIMLYTLSTVISGKGI